MALKETKLISYGESVKVWDLSNFSLLHEFTPPGISSDFLCGTWNKDGNRLVSVPSFSSKVIFSEFQREKIFNSEISIGPKISSAIYDLVNSRYLVFGTNGGEVLYWDTHHSRIEKTFCSKDSEITSLAFGTSSQLAFGTLNGEIYSYNLKNHVATGPMKCDYSEYIRSLDFKRGKLVSASDDGSINLWDVNTNKLLQGFENCHQAPAMAVKFLVPNVNMAVSVGLDKKILIFDCRTKKIVKSFSHDQPLRSLDVISDGISILAGSSKGYIHCYTLKSSNICGSIQAHRGPVKCLATNKIINGSAKSKPLAPVNDNKLHSVENIKSKETSRIAKIISSQTDDISEKLSSETSSDNYSSSTSSFSYDVPLIIHPKESFSPEQCTTTSDSQDLVKSPMCNILPGNEMQNENPVDGLIKYLAENAKAENHLPPSKNIEVDKLKTVKEPQDADMEIIIAHVTESIKEAKMEIHMDQMYLFTQMMKQFIDIKEEVKELREKCQANRNMEEELSRLREENMRLKSAY